VAVRVRMFAALRDAAGTATAEVEAGGLLGLLDDLCHRYGEPFATRLRVATVLVDGSAVARGADHPLHDGADVVLLPPVSGGAR
jgi:sulfur-carrier protein